jgi:hypothetical protein
MKIEIVIKEFKYNEGCRSSDIFFYELYEYSIYVETIVLENNIFTLTSLKKYTKVLLNWEFNKLNLYYYV